jgi:chromosome transmission fidelity protein 1
VDHLTKNNYVSKIENRKKLFREPKEAKEVDNILEEYTRSIKQFTNNATNLCGKNGALLLCVVGKLYFCMRRNCYFIQY